MRAVTSWHERVTPCIAQAVGGPGIVLHVPVAGVCVLFVQIYSSPSLRGCKLACSTGQMHRAERMRQWMMHYGQLLSNKLTQGAECRGYYDLTHQCHNSKIWWIWKPCSYVHYTSCAPIVRRFWLGSYLATFHAVMSHLHLGGLSKTVYHPLLRVSFRAI